MSLVSKTQWTPGFLIRSVFDSIDIYAPEHWLLKNEVPENSVGD